MRSSLALRIFGVLVLIAGLAAPAIGQTAAEQTELDAAAAGPSGPAPVPTGGGISCPVGTNAVQFYFSDFEADDGGWTGSGFGEWERGPVNPLNTGCDSAQPEPPAGGFSGTNVWGTTLDGCYANSNAESLLSQTFDFSSLSAPIQLTWVNWYHVFTPFDMGEVLVNGAVQFEVVASTNTADYQQESVDLSAFAGNGSVTIDYRLFATTVVNRAGWYVDDVLIETCGGGEADLSITKTADNPAPTVGSTLVWTLEVTNNGPDDATGVTVADMLPPEVSYVGDDCGATYVDPDLTWDIGMLANGATAVCNVSVTVDAEGAIVNTAIVDADGTDPVTSDNSSTSTVNAGPTGFPIPTVGQWGLIALVLLLAGSATLVLRRR